MLELPVGCQSLCEKLWYFFNSDIYIRPWFDRYTQLPKVHVTDVTTAHLISYHPDRDILPMVMANCHYTFEVGKGTKIDYSFGDLERQLMDRFLFSKSVIEMPVYEVCINTSPL